MVSSAGDFLHIVFVVFTYLQLAAGRNICRFHGMVQKLMILSCSHQVRRCAILILLLFDVKKQTCYSAGEDAALAKRYAAR